MAFSRFAFVLTLRLAALFATLAVLAYVVVATDLVAVTVVVGAIAAVEIWLVVRFVHRTNRELGRLLDAIRYDDYQQSFSLGQLGPTFADLKGAFDEVMTRFRAARLDREAQRRYLEALVEHVPVAIIAVHDDGRVDLLNSAARRLLNASAATTTRALDAYGAAFQRDVAQSKSGARTLTRMTTDGLQRHLVLSSTQLTVTGSPVRLVTLQDIQSELDSNELSAWQDMARILSHEIMNSLTPIASLARTADDMVDELARRVGAADELVTDIHAAIQTLARRSESLMRFVRSYRQFTQMPPPSLKPVQLREYVSRLEKLFLTEWAGRGIELHVAPPAGGLTIMADDSLLDQAVINLLRNAADAAAASASPHVWLDARLSERGRPIIEIGDNGPGVDESLGDKIFLPFFTTKPDGSGIGLALARQVMLVHKGAITASARPGGGALFRLTF
ncbi:MAG: PAS domain-containing protein [Deltaproteobacteria bacterium]|nr:PAS domain-containing protein [Kofleriaceae bacterium]